MGLFTNETQPPEEIMTLASVGEPGPAPQRGQSTNTLISHVMVPEQNEEYKR